MSKNNKLNNIPQKGFIYNVINKLINFVNGHTDDINKVNKQLGNIPSTVTTYRLHQQAADIPIKITTDSQFGKDGTPETNAISWIRANSHVYIGKYDYDKKVMKLRQLMDYDFNYYFGDEKERVDYAGEDLIDRNDEGFDIFMKLPKFWYKTTDAEDLSYVDVSFSTTKIDGYLEWDDRNLIGIFESYVKETDENDDDIPEDEKIVRSIGGNYYDGDDAIRSTGNISWTNYKKYARNRNTGMPTNQGYRLVTFEQHSMMALLFYGYYGTVKDKEVCGYGTNNYTKPLGIYNNTGMIDTNIKTGNGEIDSEDQEKFIDGKTKPTKFWGLENWWGNKYEWVDNIVTMDDPEDGSSLEGRINILNLDGTVKETLIFPGGYMGTDKDYCDGNIQLIKTFGKGYLGFGTGTDDYANYESSYTAVGDFGGFGYVGLRSSCCSDSVGGVACLGVDYSPDGASLSFCSRLAFIGDYEIVNSFDEDNSGE